MKLKLKKLQRGKEIKVRSVPFKTGWSRKVFLKIGHLNKALSADSRESAVGTYPKAMEPMAWKEATASSEAGSGNEPGDYTAPQRPENGDFSLSLRVTQ